MVSRFSCCIIVEYPPFWLVTWPIPLHLGVRVGLLFCRLFVVPAYTKPYLAPFEQIKLLQERGMRITDTAKAQSCIERIGYYRLSAYWYPFRQSVADINMRGGYRVLDNFKPNTNFDTILGLYVFDKNLRLILLDALERIEVALRTDISLQIGILDKRAHRDPALLHGNFAKKMIPNGNITFHQEWLQRLDAKFDTSKEEFVKHFKFKYAGDHLPIWMATELFDFGALSHFYAGLQIAHLDTIARSYSVPSGAMLSSWLRCLNDLRNLCAHHSRLWNRPLVNQPQWPKINEIPAFYRTATITNTRLFSAILIIRFLLRRVHPTTSWGDRLIKHVKELPDNPYVVLHSAGFSDDWEQHLLDVGRF